VDRKVSHGGPGDRKPDENSHAIMYSSLSKIMDEVQSTRQPLVVTKKGRPVVKLMPAKQPVVDVFGCMKDEVEILGDITSAVVPLEDWKVLR
jgi:antitoxin (DNA-binding transcriptional repressor) of toxin-antitoxin stability system